MPTTTIKIQTDSHFQDLKQPLNNDHQSFTAIKFGVTRVVVVDRFYRECLKLFPKLLKCLFNIFSKTAFDGPSLPVGTRLRFHFVTKLVDDSDGDKVLDDSRTWEKPMELLIGKKFKLEAWETCLQTMMVGEVSSFKVKLKKQILTFIVNWSPKHSHFVKKIHI